MSYLAQNARAEVETDDELFNVLCDVWFTADLDIVYIDITSVTTPGYADVELTPDHYAAARRHVARFGDEQLEAAMDLTS